MFGSYEKNRLNEPIVSINLIDAILFANAYSKMMGVAPVYLDKDGQVIKSINQTELDYKFALDNLAINDQGGFRLPTSNEWVFAARRVLNEETYTISEDGEFYLPYDFDSGATTDIENINESHRFAWVYMEPIQIYQKQWM